MPDKKTALNDVIDGGDELYDPAAEDKAGDMDDLDITDETDQGRKDKDKNNESVSIPKSKAVLIKKLLENIKESNDKLLNLLSGLVDTVDEQMISIGQLSDEKFAPDAESGEDKHIEGRIIEGVFDGENMIGPDGKQYSVPANYASKSKLVEGDILKLTITPRGTFVYKQIGPIERVRLIGMLEQEANGSYLVTADGRKLRVLTASVTYFKGQVGDEIVVLVPKSGDSKWAAVENIVKNKI